MEILLNQYSKQQHQNRKYVYIICNSNLVTFTNTYDCR